MLPLGPRLRRRPCKTATRVSSAAVRLSRTSVFILAVFLDDFEAICAMREEDSDLGLPVPEGQSSRSF